MASHATLYKSALNLSPTAAQLSLRHMRRSPKVHSDLRFALLQVLLTQACGADQTSTDTWLEFERGVNMGPPPGAIKNPSNEALAFIFDCRTYE